LNRACRESRTNILFHQIVALSRVRGEPHDEPDFALPGGFHRPIGTRYTIQVPPDVTPKTQSLQKLFQSDFPELERNEQV